MTDSATRRDVLRAVVAALALAVPGRLAGQAKKRYVCPPCGCPRDREVFDRPGTCSACGMDLVEWGRLLPHRRPFRLSLCSRPRRASDRLTVRSR